MKSIINIFILVTIVLNFSTAQTGIPKRGYAMDWLEPLANSNPAVLKNDKLELGIHLHDSVNTKIKTFLENENGLNPFNPDDVDIYIEFMHSKLSKPKKINAFYFENFQRQTSNLDIKEWNWKKVNSNTNFRIRFTPEHVGTWKFMVYIKIKGKVIARLGEYSFSCVESKLDSRIKVASNNRYFEIDGKSFIPIGLNLPKPICFYEKDSSGKVTNDPYGCADCPCAGYEEWCPHLRDLPINPKAYMVYQEELEKLKLAGGNYFRMIVFPHTFEIEYDKLGNYSSRMNVAWELDKMFAKIEKLNLKLHFDLSSGYPLSYSPYGVEAWDWPSNNENDKGYCYQHELKLKEPVDFLTDETARKFYKNRLRYMMARWGYSNSIAIVELMNEVNNKFRENGKELYEWQQEMIRFMKEDLGLDELLFTVNYYNGKPKVKEGDKSFSIPQLGVITHNVHRVEIYRSPLQEAFKKYEYLKKPLLFSEIGTGDSGFDHCDNHTEWLKDLWAVLFSGSGSSAINWNLAHAYDVWENYKSVQKFVKDVNFNNFTKTDNDLSKNKQVEMLAMHDEKQEKTVGMIHNATWNYYTIGSGGKCQSESIPKKRFKTFEDKSAYDRKSKITLKGYESKAVYVIEWYDTKTGEIVKTDSISSTSSGKIYFYYPILNKENSISVFKLRKIGVEFLNKKTEFPYEEKKVNRKKEKELEKM